MIIKVFAKLYSFPLSFKHVLTNGKMCWQVTWPSIWYADGISYFCTMKQNRITICIDLLFCLDILPIVIMLAPVEKWIVHHTAFMLTLIVYLYALYFAYRKSISRHWYWTKNTWPYWPSSSFWSALPDWSACFPCLTTTVSPHLWDMKRGGISGHKPSGISSSSLPASHSP